MRPKPSGNSLPHSAFRTHLFLHIAGPLLLIALAIGIQANGLRQSHAQYEERTRLNAQNLGSTLAASIAGSFQNIDTTLLTVIDHQQEKRSRADKQSFDAMLTNLKNRVPSLLSLRVTDASGNIVFGSGLSSTDKISVADRSYFRQLAKGPAAGMMISEPIMGRIIKRWVMICARRIDLPDGSFDGIAYGSIELEGMAERLSGKEIKLGDQDAFVLSDDNLNIITRYVHGKQDMSAVGGKVASPKLQEFLASGANTTSYISQSAIDHIERIFYVQRIPGQRMSLIVGLSSEEAFAGWRREMQNTCIATLIFALLVSSGSWLMYRGQMRKRKMVTDLEDALNFNQKILANSAIGIQVFRQDGQCIMANPAITKIFGGKQNEFLRQNFKTLPSWEKCGALHLAKQALLTRRTCHLQAEIASAPGKTIWLQWIFTPFTNQGEQQLLVMMRDISDIQQAHEALEESNRKLLALSATDGLTGIANRRSFDDALTKEWRRAVRSKQPLALAMIDVDQFKDYNDRYGHQGGDECLRSVAHVLQRYVRRAGDLIARYGGEEFVFIGPATDSASALHLAEAIRAELELLALPHELSPFGHVTISIGVTAIVPADDQNAEILVQQADAALYQAKGQGRNQVIHYAAGTNGQGSNNSP